MPIQNQIFAYRVIRRVCTCVDRTAVVEEEDGLPLRMRRKSTGLVFLFLRAVSLAATIGWLATWTGMMSEYNAEEVYQPQMGIFCGKDY